MQPLLDVNEVFPGLWVGPMPTTVAFVQALRETRGVAGVVSLQTDEDLLDWSLTWEKMVALLREGGISAVERVPIIDFSDGSLSQGIPLAIQAVARLREERRSVYLHCTAGINRSPTVAIAYLIEHERMSPDQAWDDVHSRRRVLPRRGALERWLAKR